MSKSVMDIFYNKEVSIYAQLQSEPNELGVTTTVWEHITDSKAVANPLSTQQAKNKYGIDTSLSVEYTIEYFEEVCRLIMQGVLLFIVDGDVHYRIESANVYEQFYVLDACISVAVVKVDDYGYNF